MSDEFERRLAVALKAAPPDLLPGHAPVTAVGLDTVPVVRGPRRPRVLLVTAVLLSLALVAGGAWWIVRSAKAPTPAADVSACALADLTLTRVTPSDAVLAAVAVRAARACTLMTPPVLTVGGEVAPFDATPADPDDDGAFHPVVLPAGGATGFAVGQVTPSGPRCAGPARQVEATVGFGDRSDVAFDLVYGVCGGAPALTGYDLGAAGEVRARPPTSR